MSFFCSNELELELATIHVSAYCFGRVAHKVDILLCNNQQQSSHHGEAMQRLSHMHGLKQAGNSFADIPVQALLQFERSQTSTVVPMDDVNLAFACIQGCGCSSASLSPSVFVVNSLTCGSYRRMVA